MVGIAAIINAFLWRLGGAGANPFKRHWRRIGYPVLAGIMCLFFRLPIFRVVLACLVGHATTRLPLTLIGDAVNKHWANWVWLWVLGFLYGLPSVALQGWIGFAWALLPCLTFGASVTLSNTTRFSAIFTHDFCEGVTGAAVFLSLIAYK